MKLTINVPDSLEKVLTEQQLVNWQGFLQMMTNRVLQGGVRYGRPDKRKRYAERLETEWVKYLGAYWVFDTSTEYYLKTYPKQKARNFELLLNIAVYCWLESEAPQHPRFHFDNTVESATRDETEKD